MLSCSVDPFSIQEVLTSLNKATNLQVLILQGLNQGIKGDTLDLDYFCEQLANCQPFWSKFQILKIVPGILEKDELKKTMAKEYTVSQASLDQLITAYFSAPADHSQLVQFSFTHIKCQDSAYCNPTVDRTYQQFKNIRFSDCRFTFKAIPDVISMWLGQGIKILEKEKETSSILFQVDHKDSVLGHKRQYCEVAELNSENDDQIN